MRPPQKFFNAQELAALGKQSIHRQRFPGMDLFCDYYDGNYFHDGYLLKEVTVGSMIKPCTDEDMPTLDELGSFRQRKKGRGEYDDDHQEDENEGSKMAGSLLDELSELQGKTGLGKPSSGGGLLIGDTVEVIEGDLVGMQGKLISLDGTTVKVKPTNNTVDLGGTQEVEFLASQVRKLIQVGDHVKVTDGRYANETGVVVAVEKLEGETDCTAVVLTDVTHKEVTGKPLSALFRYIMAMFRFLIHFWFVLCSTHFSAPPIDGGGIRTRPFGRIRAIRSRYAQRRRICKRSRRHCPSWPRRLYRH